jgi:hypothetical protein
MGKNIKSFIIGGVLASSLGALAAVNIPNTFSAGTPIKASEINANFTSLKAALEALQTTPLTLPTKLEGTNPTTANALLTVTTKDVGTAIHGVSNDPASAAAGVQGDSFSPGGFGVYGLSSATAGSGTGVYGQGGIGVWGKSVGGRTGVFGLNEGNANGSGVEGNANGSNAAGVYGLNPKGPGVWGRAVEIGKLAPVAGVYGESAAGYGLYGATLTGTAGVFGVNYSNTSGSGVEGRGDGSNAAGVYGVNPSGPGLWGRSTNGAGVFGRSTNGYGVEAISEFTALKAESQKNTAAIVTTRGTGVSALIINQWGSGNIITGRDSSNAEVFRVTNAGDVQVRGVTLTSDRHAKTNFSSLDTLAVLEKVVALPISRWNYKTDASSLNHIGPMAQDFHAAFGLNGSDDTHINAVDAQGVALAAIQGLNAKLERSNQKLQAENARLRALLANLEARLSKLERR